MINRDMTIREIVENHPECTEIFEKYNLGCVRCLASSFETIEEGLSAHGLNVDEVIGELNEAIGK
jgi:hybrid cluster-associated redox disulfide protein